MEKLVFEALDVKKYVKDEGFDAVSDTKALESVIQKIIDSNSKAVEEYLSGNEKSFNFLVGQVMRETKGQADPVEVNRLVKKSIGK